MRERKTVQRRARRMCQVPFLDCTGSCAKQLRPASTHRDRLRCTGERLNDHEAPPVTCRRS
eukprot:3274073-Alexandrium_andersonii.AAC.1